MTLLPLPVYYIAAATPASRNHHRTINCQTSRCGFLLPIYTIIHIASSPLPSTSPPYTLAYTRGPSFPPTSLVPPRVPFFRLRVKAYIPVPSLCISILYIAAPLYTTQFCFEATRYLFITFYIGTGRFSLIAHCAFLTKSSLILHMSRIYPICIHIPIMNG